MSARTTTVRRALAQATVRAGRIHLAGQQDTGTWIGMCGRQIRSREITTFDTLSAEHAAVFCPDCASLALVVADTVEAGVALLLEAAAEAPGARLADVAVDRIRVPATHARLEHGDLDGLTASVREHGVLQPLVVRPAGDDFELVIGARRLAAARSAGLASVPAVVAERDDEDAAVVALVENLHRTDLNPIEQAHAFEQLLEQHALTITDVARRVGVSRPQVSNTLRLLALPEHLREQVATGALTSAHGRALLRITDPAEQDALAERILEEDLTTRDADAAARAAQNPRTTSRHGDRLDDVARLLTGLLNARVQVTTTAERARVVIDVAEADLPRILAQLGVQAVAA